MVERCNRSLLAMLRAVVSKQQDDWDDHLPAVLSAYRSPPHSSTGQSVSDGLWSGNDHAT